MKTVRPNEAEIQELLTAAVNLKSANQRLAAANKDVDNAKSILRRWLNTSREIDVDTLQIGEIVNIEGVCLIERGKQNKFDEARFAVDSPAVYGAFRRDFPMTKFKPLV
jgi:hypothetical protein